VCVLDSVRVLFVLWSRFDVLLGHIHNTQAILTGSERLNTHTSARS